VAFSRRFESIALVLPAQDFRKSDFQLKLERSTLQEMLIEKTRLHNFTVKGLIRRRSPLLGPVSFVQVQKSELTIIHSCIGSDSMEQEMEWR